MEKGNSLIMAVFSSCVRVLGMSHSWFSRRTSVLTVVGDGLSIFMWMCFVFLVTEKDSKGKIECVLTFENVELWVFGERRKETGLRFILLDLYWGIATYCT